MNSSFFRQQSKSGESWLILIQSQFKKKLEERLVNPHVPSAKLRGYERVYKIKLRTAGYRLVYEVVDDELVVYILAIGKREKNSIYRILNKRIND